MKLGNLILKPPGKATGCLLVTRLESAPGVTWGPGGPKCPAPCAGTLPPNTPYFSPALESQEAGGERQWRLVRKPLPGRMKRKEKSLLVESVMPHCSAARSLSVHICAQSGSAHPAERLLHHRPRSASPLPETCCLFYPPPAQTPFSPLQLHPLPNRCSVAKLQSTYVTFFN